MNYAYSLKIIEIQWNRSNLYSVCKEYMYLNTWIIKYIMFEVYFNKNSYLNTLYVKKIECLLVNF